MAIHWLREVNFLTGPTRVGFSFYSKMLCYWMYNVLGYTNFSESVTPVAIDTYDPNVAFTGNNASFNASGTDFNLVDATYGAFNIIADVGKWILIKDTTPGEEANSGWYRITSVPDINTATLEYCSDPTEYPIQHAGTDLEWWMMPEDSNTPDTIGDYWILRTPHADAWEIEMTLSGSYLVCRMSLNADWTATGKILPGKYYGWNGTEPPRHYAEADTEGTHFNLWWSNNSVTPWGSAIAAAKFQPIETAPAHDDTELWTLLGPTSTGGSMARSIGATHFCNGYVWREDTSSSFVCHCLEWSFSSNPALSFTLWTSNEANARTGATDIKPNLGPYVMDIDNLSRRFEIIGLYPGMEECRSNLALFQTLDDLGTKDKIHIGVGFVVPWPGLTPQFP